MKSKLVKAMAIAMMGMMTVGGVAPVKASTEGTYWVDEHKKDFVNVVDIRPDGTLTSEYEANRAKSLAVYKYPTPVLYSVFKQQDAATLNEEGLRVLDIERMNTLHNVDVESTYNIDVYRNEQGLRFIKVSPKNYSNGKALYYVHGGAAVIGFVQDQMMGTIFNYADMGYDVYVIDYHTRLNVKEDGTEYTADDMMSEITEGYYYVENIVGEGNVDFHGDSYGGTGVMALLHTLNQTRPNLQGKAYLVSPWTDMTCDSYYYHLNDSVEGDILFAGGTFVKDVAANYIGNKSATDPTVSPLYGNFSNLNMEFSIIVGEKEMLRGDSETLAEKLLDQGQKVALNVLRLAAHDITTAARTGFEEPDLAFNIMKYAVPQAKQNPYWKDNGNSYWVGNENSYWK